MTTWARVINNSAVDVVTSDPTKLFHPAIAAEFIVVSDSVKDGWSYNPISATWAVPAAPVAPPPPPPPPMPPMTPIQFYLAFTPSERIAIKKSTDAMVVEFWATYQFATQQNQTVDPTLFSVIEGVNYLAIPTTATPPGPGIIVATRVPQILAGIPQ